MGKRKSANTRRDEAEGTSFDVKGADASVQQEHSANNEAKTDSPPPVMDVLVHRLRHLDVIPRGIVCLRASPATEDGGATFVALSRESGSVELKAPNEKFRTIAEIAGFKDKAVNAMTWICGTASSSQSDQTLVGGSRDGILFVVDFKSGCFSGMTSSGGGGIFALASPCERRAGSCCSGVQCPNLFAAGCEDGSVRIFEVVKAQQSEPTEPPKLALVSTIPSASGASVLSVAWRKSAASFILFAGLSDGTIRRYDCDDRNLTNSDQRLPGWKSQLRMTVENLGRNSPTRVWTLQCLTDGTVVSGDSLGHVQIWNGTNGTLQQSFDQSEVKADVLDIGVSFDECKIFASGVDPRVVCIERTRPATTDADKQWLMSHIQRPHTHDVKAITICRQRYLEDGARSDPVPLGGRKFHDMLCTGGIDTKLCSYYVEEFRRRRPTSHYPMPSISPFCQAKDARILLLKREAQIDLYKLEDKPAQHPVKGALAIPENGAHIGSIQLTSPCNLVCAAISDDGKNMAVSDALSLFLFRIQYVSENNATSMVPTKLSMDVKVNGTITAMQFNGNDKLIAATADDSLHFISFSDDQDIARVTLSKTEKQKKSKTTSRTELFPIQSLAISDDKRWMATLQGGFNFSHISVFSLEDNGMACLPWWSLPDDLEAPATALRFANSAVGSATELVVSCSNFSFYIFNVIGRKLAPFSEELEMPVSKLLPTELVSRNDYPVCIRSNPASPSKILLGSFGAFAMVDLGQKPPQRCRFVPDRHVRTRRKRKRSLSGAEATKASPVKQEAGVESIICLRYNSVLHMDFVAENEMVIVEQPWLNVIATFPEAIERKVFGT